MKVRFEYYNVIESNVLTVIL